MKKFRKIFLSLFVIFLMTGCVGEEKEKVLVCTSTENEEEMSIEQVISMTYQNDKLKHMTIEINTTVTSPDAKTNWEQFKKSMNEENEEFTKDGVSLKVYTDDQNYKYNTILDIDVENASEEVLKEQGFDDLKNDNSTLESSKEDAESDGAVCEIR